MESFANTISLIKTYESLKKDLFTLIVKESISPLDYNGKVEFREKKTTALRYSQTCHFSTPEEDETASSLLEDMLKSDLRIWNKTQGIERVSIVVVDDDNDHELICLVDYLN